MTFKSRRRSFTPLIKKCYEHYFGCKVSDEDKRWAPHFCCVTCAWCLTAWAKGSRSVPFAIPMVWREPTLLLPDQYHWCNSNVQTHCSISKFTICDEANEPHLLTQGDLNDIVRNLNLWKKQAELLGSRLKGWKLLRQDAKVCFYRGRHEEFKDFFYQEDGVVFCNDVC